MTTPETQSYIERVDALSRTQAVVEYLEVIQKLACLIQHEEIQDILPSNSDEFLNQALLQLENIEQILS